MSESYRQLVAALPLTDTDAVAKSRLRQHLEKIRQLPLAQPQRAVADMVNMLQASLGENWQGADRLDLLEAMESPSRAIAEGLQKQIVAESHPLPPAKAKLAETVQTLRRLQGESCCMAAWELASPDGRIGLFGKGKVVLALNMALEYLHRALVLSYQMYRVPSAGIWRRLHAAYAFAADKGLQDKECTIAAGLLQSSARQRYAHALLLAMSNPYGMQRAELEQAVQITAALAPDAQFRGRPSGVAATGGEDSDAGPGYSPQERDRAAQDQLSLDLDPLLTLLGEHLAWAPPESGLVSLRRRQGGVVEATRDMLELMSRAWQGSVDREFKRVVGGHAMTALPGLSAIHQALAGGDDFDTFNKHLSGGNIELSAGSNMAAWLGGRASSRSGSLQVTVLDQSLGGYRLSWPASQQMRVRIGELLALVPGQISEETVDVDEMLLLGILRWFRSEDNDTLSVGVELLSRRAWPAAVRIIEQQRGRGQLQRALVLDDTPGQEQVIMARVFQRRPAMLELSYGVEKETDADIVRRAKRHVDEVAPLSSSYYRVSLSVENRQQDKNSDPS